MCNLKLRNGIACQLRSYVCLTQHRLNKWINCAPVPLTRSTWSERWQTQIAEGGKIWKNGANRRFGKTNVSSNQISNGNKFYNINILNIMNGVFMHGIRSIWWVCVCVLSLISSRASFALMLSLIHPMLPRKQVIYFILIRRFATFRLLPRKAKLHARFM